MFGFPNFLLPGAGGNWQTIDTRWWSPNVTVNYAGNPAVERDVIENVASYGKQIGWLNEIVTALVKIEGEQTLTRDPKAADAWNKFKKAKERIEEIKLRRTEDAVANARDALAKLGAADKHAYAYLVSTLDPKKPPAGT